MMMLLMDSIDLRSHAFSQNEGYRLEAYALRLCQVK
jgi:hypothetical protein